MKRPRLFYSDFDVFARVVVDELPDSVPTAWSSRVRGLLHGDVDAVVVAELVVSDHGDVGAMDSLEAREANRLSRYRGIFRSLVARKDMAKRALAEFIDELATNYSHELMLACSFDCICARDAEVVASANEALARESHIEQLFSAIGQAAWEADLERMALRTDVCALLAARGDTDASTMTSFRDESAQLSDRMHDLALRMPAVPPDETPAEFAAFARRHRAYMDAYVEVYRLDLELSRRVAGAIADASADRVWAARWVSEGSDRLDVLARVFERLRPRFTEDLERHRLELAAHEARSKVEEAEFASVPVPDDAAEARAFARRAFSVWRAQLDGTAALLARARAIPLEDTLEMLDLYVEILAWWKEGVRVAAADVADSSYVLDKHDAIGERYTTLRHQAQSAFAELRAFNTLAEELIASSHGVASGFETLLDDAEALEARLERFNHASAYAQLRAAP